MNDTLVSPLYQNDQKNQPIILPPARHASARQIGFAINRLKPVLPATKDDCKVFAVRPMKPSDI
ncbi:hypothetical protein AAGS40_02235 [Paraburkholderia sp. PREW-6R]|uniref:hypothetical protein n=1 Tax=Paraburkholderia sp. PREW-6R TaxID=3141544 RepID=UPI0031F5D835